MSLTSETLSLYFLIKLVTIQCYSYQTEPLFLSFSELAALEANSLHQTDKPRFVDLDRVGDDEIETFVVKCHGDSMEVVVKADLFDPGLAVEPTHFRLGPSRAAQDHCRARESGAGEFIIRAPLTHCGSKVEFTQSAVRYTNLLLYSPPAAAPGGAAVPVQCDYKRSYTVSSGALKPTWSPPISIQPTHLDLDFHLRLMTSDWSSERKSSVYFLGEVLNMEASVDHRHLPLRLYADSCVATLTSDVTSHPRYPFIDHHGCFTDSQLDGSSSRFLPRVQGRLLHIQLEPFLFHQDLRHTVYITCYLEAEPISDKEPVKRACSFISGRWRSVDGDDRVCQSCSSVKSNHKRALRSRTQHRQRELHRETILGPLIFLPRQLST
ncbi:zona pellucida sperm-binding protein 3-like [Centropristis striata]|uniref:zona pellucida sperm-binding protein 3-like n=1 Tax=Centropristis striata TaxID=184440 RepID=UPI0027E0FEA7|nr:zona pellucida sperm-binding protein 3-like [Centropristis striata]